MNSQKTLQRIPVFVLSGFLGSGKTTILNRMLTEYPHSAVIINEFGTTPIDQALLKRHKIPITTLSGGCVCCQVHGSLAPLLKNLRMAWESNVDKPFDRIFIETSGVASPEPILDTLLNERWLSKRFLFKGLITTVSATCALNYLEQFAEAKAQIAWADHLLITQTDLVDQTDLLCLKAQLDQWAPDLPRLEVVHGQFDPGLLVQASYEYKGKNKPELSTVAAHSFSTVSYHLNQPVNWKHLENILSCLLAKYNDQLIRLKGVVWTLEHEEPIVVQSAGGILFHPWPLEARDSDDQRGRLVFISSEEIKGLAEEIKGLLQGLDSTSTFDKGITS